MTQDQTSWERVAGAETLRAWFGRIPAFHDANVKSFSLSSGSGATLAIHAFEMTAEVDEKGYFVLRNHALVSFKLEGLGKIAFEDFDQGSVLDRLTIVERDQVLVLQFSSHIGVSGILEAETISIEIAPFDP